MRLHEYAVCAIVEGDINLGIRTAMSEADAIGQHVIDLISDNCVAVNDVHAMRIDDTLITNYPLGEFVDDIQYFLSKGDKIGAIREIRDKTGLGLTVCKAIAEAIKETDKNPNESVPF